jgi:polysaccharide biosynthesis/export protein
MKKIVIVATMLFLGVIAGLSQEIDSFIREYKIGPKDLLQIKVPDVAELANLEIRVSEDGTINAPYIGNLKIKGMTKDEVEKKIAEILSEKYVRNPQVTVFIKEYQSQQVSVIGAVHKPGMFEVVGRQNLLQIISKAGGLTELASNEILIIREGKDGASTSLKIDLEDLMVNGNPKLNIPIQANDVINIPVDRPVVVYVYGAVKNPGALQTKMTQKITLLKAIAQAGGLGDSAKSTVSIKRMSKQGKEELIKMNLKDIIKGKIPDVFLKEGDVVIVEESIF